MKVLSVGKGGIFATTKCTKFLYEVWKSKFCSRVKKEKTLQLRNCISSYFQYNIYLHYFLNYYSYCIMTFIITSFEQLLHIYEHIFWLKELLTLLKSTLFFLLVVWCLRRKEKIKILFFLSACIGIACVYFGDNEYWSDNDILKFIAPSSLYICFKTQEYERNSALFAFLGPYAIVSYEFYRGFEFIIMSLIIYTLIVLGIIIVKNNFSLSLSISAIVALCFNYVGIVAPPSTSELLFNPAITGLATMGVGWYYKSPLYATFLKTYWFTLVCFAYFGSWMFHLLKLLISTFHQESAY